MNLPKLSIKKGIYFTLFAILIAYIAIPLIYNHFGTGSEQTKYLVTTSTKVIEECGKVDNFLIVPWSLAFSDTEERGELKIGYWFKCKNNGATVHAEYHHVGQGWVADSVEVKLNNEIIEVVDREKKT